MPQEPLVAPGFFMYFRVVRVQQTLFRGLPAVRKEAASPEEATRLAAERHWLTRAAHPGVVRLLPAEGSDALWLRDVGSRSLATLTPLEPAVLCGLGAATATVLGDLHDLGIAHMAPTADHVLVDPDGRPVLCSLGRATSATPDAIALDVRLLAVALAEAGGTGIPRRARKALGRAGRCRRGYSARTFARELAAAVGEPRLPAADPVAARAGGPSSYVPPTGGSGDPPTLLASALPTDRPTDRPTGETPRPAVGDRRLSAAGTTAGTAAGTTAAVPPKGRWRRERRRRRQVTEGRRRDARPALGTDRQLSAGTRPHRPHRARRALRRGALATVLVAVAGGLVAAALPVHHRLFSAPPAPSRRAARPTQPRRPRGGPAADPAPAPARHPADRLPRSPSARPVGTTRHPAGAGTAGHPLRRQSPQPSLPSPTCPAGDAGCRPVALHGGVFVDAGRRWAVSDPADIVTLGRWTCAQPLAAVLDTATGQIWVFPSWGRVTARPVADVAGAASLLTVPGRNGCDLLSVRRRRGNAVLVDPRPELTADA